MTVPEFKTTPRCDVVEQCPRCQQMAWEAEKIHGRPARYMAEGLIDCPNCRSILSVKRGLPKGEAELLEGEPEENISQAVRDVTEEDKRRGNGKSHSGGGGTPPPKKRFRNERRYEQEPVFGRGEQDKKKTEKTEKRLEVTLTTSTRDRLQEWARITSIVTGKRVSMADGIRVAMKIHLEDLRAAEEHEYACDKSELQMHFYKDELASLALACDPARLAVSRGAVIEACLLRWLPEEDKEPDIIPRPASLPPE